MKAFANSLVRVAFVICITWLVCYLNNSRMVWLYVIPALLEFVALVVSMPEKKGGNTDVTDTKN